MSAGDKLGLGRLRERSAIFCRVISRGSIGRNAESSFYSVRDIKRDVVVISGSTVANGWTLF